MTTQRGTSRADVRYTAATARDLYARWTAYLDEARAALPADATADAIVAHAAAAWRAHEAPELGFVPDELRAVLRERRHDTTGAEFLDRIVRGEATALRRRADGAVVYLPGDLAGALTDAERAAYEPYDPMLARALRRHALEGEIEAAAEERAT
jgi:hypothetical protein